jgi:hypothetical protein
MEKFRNENEDKGNDEDDNLTLQMYPETTQLSEPALKTLE